MKRHATGFFLLAALLILTAALATAQDRSQAASSETTPRAYLPLLRAERDLKGTFDMANFIVGSGGLYEVWQYIASQNRESQARHQTQFKGQRFYHTKGNELYAEWEELWLDADYVYRGTDTSPGSGLYYTLRDAGQYGSKWSPRHWNVGDIFERNPMVTFYYKSNCAVNANFPQRTWLKFVAYYPQFTFDAGGPDDITVYEVIELAWLLVKDGQPEERYFYARDFGLVGWANNHGDFSRISEIHAPGARPDNAAEVIPCLDTGDSAVPDVLIWPVRPYEPPYRAK